MIYWGKGLKRFLFFFFFCKSTVGMFVEDLKHTVKTDFGFGEQPKPCKTNAKYLPKYVPKRPGSTKFDNSKDKQ